MDVSIPKGYENFVREQIEAGSYGSESEVLEDGLRLLKERKEEYLAKREELRKEIAIGTAQLRNGEGVHFDVEDIIRRG